MRRVLSRRESLTDALVRERWSLTFEPRMREGSRETGKALGLGCVRGVVLTVAGLVLVWVLISWLFSSTDNPLNARSAAGDEHVLPTRVVQRLFGEAASERRDL